MSAFRAFTVLGCVVVLVGSSVAQKANPAADAMPVGQANLRPAIFQRTAQSVVASASLSSAQLSTTSLRLASDHEMDGMEQTLGSYVTAFENLSLAEIKQVWPDLDRQHATAFKDVFAGFKGASSKPGLALQCAVPRIATDTANVECRETITYQLGKGKGKTKELGPVRVSIQLKRGADRWVVSDMRGAD
jgi:hypothetical protein